MASDQQGDSVRQLDGLRLRTVMTEFERGYEQAVSELEQLTKRLNDMVTEGEGLHNGSHFVPDATDEPEWPDESEPTDGLVDWWTRTARGDISSSLEKIRQYGGISLTETGRGVWELMDQNTWSSPEPPEQLLQELAIWVYIRGKVSRAFAALSQGDMPSDDTLFDIHFYAMMARRIRQCGVWPG